MKKVAGCALGTLVVCLLVFVSRGFASCPPLSLSSPEMLPGGWEGQISYQYQLQHQGGAGAITYKVIAGSLPPGLMISPQGLISGNPSKDGIYNFVVKANDSCTTGVQTVSKTFYLDVYNAITPKKDLPGGVVGLDYKLQIEASLPNPPVTFSLAPGSSLPAGLSMSTGGLITGKPTAAVKDFPFSVRAANACPPGCKTIAGQFLITITEPPRTLPQPQHSLEKKSPVSPQPPTKRTPLWGK